MSKLRQRPLDGRYRSRLQVRVTLCPLLASFKTAGRFRRQSHIQLQLALAIAIFNSAQANLHSVPDRGPWLNGYNPSCVFFTLSSSAPFAGSARTIHRLGGDCLCLGCTPRCGVWRRRLCRQLCRPRYAVYRWCGRYPARGAGSRRG